MRYLRLLTFAAIAAALTACAHQPVRCAIAIPAPDVAVVKAPIQKAREYSVEASGKVAAVTAAVTRSQALVEQLQPAPVVDQIKLELLTAREAADIATQNLLANQQALIDADAKADVLQVEANSLRDRATKEQIRADTAEDRVTAEIKAHGETKGRYFRLKLFNATIIAAVLALIALWFTPKTPPWLMIVIPGAAGAAGFALAWRYL